MHKLIRGALVSAVVVASIGTGPAAFAANHDNSCDSGESCVFRDSNYGGGMDDMATTDASWIGNTFSSGSSVHDAVSSGFGNDRAERYWVNVNFTGAYFTLGVNQYDPLWTTNQPGSSAGASYNFNDKCDSNAVYVP